MLDYLQQFKAPIFILFISVAVSAGFILFYRHSPNPTDAGRGGALAVALSFAYLFLERGGGSRMFDFLSTDVDRITESLQAPCITDTERLARLEAKHRKLVDRIMGANRLDQADRKINNILLTLSSVIGTMAWGFGDLFVSK